MSLRFIIEIYQFAWSIESHAQQRLAWQDAVEARHARARADAQAAQQLRAMMVANPSGSLGHAKLNDDEKLKRSGLL